MKKILIIAGALSLSPLARAQSVGDAVPGDARKIIDHAAKILKKAKSGGQAEDEKILREKATAPPRVDELAARTADPARSEADSQKMVEQADRKLEPALRNASPEGRLLIAQSDAAPALRTPPPDASPGPVRRASSPEVAVAAGRKASPDAPAAAGETAKEGEVVSRMEITSQGALYFDSSNSIAVFTDDVVLTHPKFHLTSDELEVHMLKDSDKKKALEPPAKSPAGQTPPPGTAPKAAPADESARDSDIKQAIATGRKVVIQKLDENGEVQVGICRHATYIGETGDIIMRDMPQVQRGMNATIATDPSTYMVIKQNGQFKTYGPARTEIIQKKPAAGKPAAPGTAPASPAKAIKP